MNLRARLLDWYDEHARDLPWRRTRDPYAIWVSEIMLQQTRVDTVLRYYDRFIERFPSAEALARAPEDDVMSAWSGLGYYRRARLLHRGVREVVERYGGEVPRDAAARRGLPGVGRYTAGAVGSIAFELPEPLVDGNVARVLARLRGIDTPLGRADTERALWAAAEALVVGQRPGDFNQALMELGATVCLPATPRCEACPWRAECEALASSRTDQLPVVKPRREPKDVQLVVAHVRDRRGALLVTRSDGALFGGLWGPPMAEGKGLPRARALVEPFACDPAFERRRVAEVEHVLTHRRLRVSIFRARTAATSHAASLDARFVTPPELDALGVSKLTRKLLAAEASAAPG